MQLGTLQCTDFWFSTRIGQTESEKILGSRFMMHWIQKTKYQVESLVVNKNQLELYSRPQSVSANRLLQKKQYMPFREMLEISRRIWENYWRNLTWLPLLSFPWFPFSSCMMFSLSIMFLYSIVNNQAVTPRDPPWFHWSFFNTFSTKPQPQVILLS